jgi:hypothetical protein
MAFGRRVALCLGACNLETKQGDAMKALMLGKLAMVIVAAMALAVRAMAQESPNRSPQQQVFVAGMEKRNIVVSLEDRKLALDVNGQVKKVYPVAVGTFWSNMEQGATGAMGNTGTAALCSL